MKVFSLLIEQMGEAVCPHVSSLLEQLPRVWSEAQGHSMGLLRCAIIVTLTHIVSSLGEASVQLQSFLCQVAYGATNVKLVQKGCEG